MRAIHRVALLAAALVLVAPRASAELLVSPLRQVVTAKAPLVRYRISNPSDRIVEARIGWIDLSATPEGYAPAAPVVRPSLSAAPFLVVSPARLRLEPGGHAEVVVRLKKGAAIPAGERRSHLLIETTPSRTPLRRASTGLEVDVGLGVSTPVILRGGYSAPALAFGETRLVRDDHGLLALETTLTSAGKYSAYGTLDASLEADGETLPLARLGNVAVYPDSGARKIALPLLREHLPEGVLRVVYASDGDGRTHVLADRTFQIAAPPPPPVRVKVSESVSADR